MTLGLLYKNAVTGAVVRCSYMVSLCIALAFCRVPPLNQLLIGLYQPASYFSSFLIGRGLGSWQREVNVGRTGNRNIAQHQSVVDATVQNKQSQGQKKGKTQVSNSTYSLFHLSNFFCLF